MPCLCLIKCCVLTNCISPKRSIVCCTPIPRNSNMLKITYARTLISCASNELVVHSRWITKKRRSGANEYFTISDAYQHTSRPSCQRLHFIINLNSSYNALCLRCVKWVEIQVLRNYSARNLNAKVWASFSWTSYEMVTEVLLVQMVSLQMRTM